MNTVWIQDFTGLSLADSNQIHLQFAEAPQVQGLDIKALKIELKANHFYRGNPYVNAVGALLGFSSEQLDKFFEKNDYTYLINKNEKEVEDND